MNLRPMTMDDADKMLEWKNYPETRQFAIVGLFEIRREEHIKWLEQNVQYFQIIEVDGKKAGAVRINGGEISIWIDRDFRGKGLATDVIKSVSQPGMIAKIVDGNIASMRAFIKCGYVPISYIKGIDNFITRTVNFYIFKC